VHVLFYLCPMTFPASIFPSFTYDQHRCVRSVAPILNKIGLIDVENTYRYSLKAIRNILDLLYWLSPKSHSPNTSLITSALQNIIQVEDM